MDDKKKLDDLRHSTAHLLAAAVLELYPHTKLTIGPAIENGFYYDFEFDKKDLPEGKQISEENFAEIEKIMQKILPTWNQFTHRIVTADEARKVFHDNPYKTEMINDLERQKQTITFYKCGEFEDLCRGGHAENPKKEIGAFKLLSVAGAYWRGDEKNPMLTRIYGTSFPTRKELDEYLHILEEAKKRDHKALGPQLELFMFHESAPGMAYWLPKGLALYNTLYDFSRKLHREAGYTEVATPLLNKKGLYETSGHWQHYRDDMFVSPMSFLTGESKEVLEGTEVLGLKPMNCPNAMIIFGSKTRSYKDLPMRLSDTDMLHRFELSGTLNGLFRTRAFRQDDAHIFISIKQVQEEFNRIMKLIKACYSPFNISYRLRFGTRPEDFMGDPKDWDSAEKSLQTVLEASGEEYFAAEGEGAFYGPKVDILMKDILGREWQTGTIQLDFQQPKNFKLKFTMQDGSEETPVAFHRAIYGTFERFLGILIEHYAGAFPLWMAPVQVAVIPISEKNVEYAKKVQKALLEAGIRSELDDRNETMQGKIRLATLQKIPYMCIIGGKEEELSSEKKNLFVSVRTRTGRNVSAFELKKFIEQLKEEIENKLQNSKF